MTSEQLDKLFVFALFNMDSISDDLLQKLFKLEVD